MPAHERDLMPETAPAADLCETSAAPLIDNTDGTYRIHVGDAASALTRSAREELQRKIDTRSVPALAYEFRDVTMDTTRWMISRQGVLVSESRYLVHTKNLSRSFASHASRTPRDLDDSKIWIVGANWAIRNYWHWHAQVLPAIIHSRELVPPDERSRVAIASNELSQWQIDGLVANGFFPNQVIAFPREQVVFFRRVIYSDLLGGRSVFASNEAKRTMRAALLEAGTPRHRRVDLQRSEKVYISRGDTRRRPVANEKVLEAALVSRGFAIVSNSSLSLSEQIAMYSNADVVVAPHGAGSTNTLFMRHGAYFLELQQASHVNAGPLSLGKMSSPAAYIACFPDDGRGQDTQSWEVDVDETLGLLDQVP